MNLPALDNFKKVGWRELFRVNKILRALVLSDVLIISGFGLMTPIFAVFVTNQILGGSLVVIGIAESIYLATKSIFQVPVGVLIDNTKGEKIDFWLAFLGSLLMTVSALLYIWAALPVHIYLIQFIYGIGAAISYPAWMGLFTRNMEQGKESFIWSLQSTFWQVGSALTAALGGILAESFGFHKLFVLVALVSLAGSLLLVVIYPEVKK